jgi:ABC-type multidrug transport system ATPase subunit
LTPAIVAQGLTKDYGAVRAIDALDLVIEQGTVFGLLGPNGAGKSTTFGILCGWLAPTSGIARVLDVDASELYRLRGRVGALPQDALFPPQISVGAQLAHYGRLAGQDARRARAEVERVLALVGLPEAAQKRSATLSHGQRKRVGLAQALIGEPEALLLDEPTAGLDPKAARGVRDLIGSLAPAATVVVSSHNLAEIQDICSHGAILDRGRCIVSGTIDALTLRGQEVTIETRPEAAVPWDALRKAFGADAVRDGGDGQIHLAATSGEDVADLIGAALRILLDAGTPILGVDRGQSLEQRFLELTGSA